jgi:hypothetical protein
MLDLKDLFITPFYLLVTFFALLIIRSVMVKDLTIRKYFFSAVYLKIFGALSVGLVYQYYYTGGGDTTHYFNGAGTIFRAMFESPYKAFLLLMAKDQPIYEAYEYTSEIMFYGDGPSYFICKLASIFSLLSFHTYSIIALFFALISFSGIWAMYLALYKMYPNLHKEFAIALFYIPSVFFWGSGILKDTVTLGALGWAFYAFTNIFIRKTQLRRSIFILFLSSYFILSIKIYILLCFIPAISVWLFSIFSNQIKSPTTRNFLRPFFFILAIAFGLLAAGQISADNDKYSLDKIAETSTTTSSYLLSQSISDRGSGYDLGTNDGTIIGFLSKAPQAIWVTLFRPYLWESKNVNMLFAAVESFFVLILCITTIRKVGISNVFGLIKSNDFLTFSFIFSFTFAFAIGVSTSNFGTLVRYKIPLLPFFISAVYLLRSFEPKKAKIR